MSQVNLLSVDVGQGSETKGANGSASIKSQAKGSAFSEQMAQHYPRENQTDQDGEINRNGKLVSKTATEQDKKVKAEDAYILPVTNKQDDKVLADKGDVVDDKHTLPVPLMPEAEAANDKPTKIDDQHTLPLPITPEIEVVGTKATKIDDQHTLPVPVTPEIEAVNAKVTKIGDQHTLPVPVTPEIEAENTKVKNIDDQHTLPVPVTSEIQAVTVSTRAKDEQHTLPVPGGVLVNESKTHADANQDTIGNIKKENALDRQRPNGVSTSTDNDDTVNLLNMLNGAQKLLAKSNDAQENIEPNGKVNSQQILADSKSTTPSKSSTSQQHQAALDKVQVNDLMPENNKADIEAQADIDKSVIEPEISTKAELSKQLLTQEGELASINKQNSTPRQQDNKLESEVLGKAHETSAAQNARLATSSSEEGKTEVTEDKITSVQNAKQANAVEFNAAEGKESKRNINEKTTSAVAAPTSGTSLDSEQEKQMNNAKDTLLDAEPELMVTSQGEKQALSPEKIASSFNQTLDAQATRTTSTLGELAAQQEQSYQNTVDKLTSNAVQSQKSITALQTETIAIYRKDFADAVKDKVMVMINQKIQQVDIQLDPPEMGNIHVRVNLQNEQAAVQFIVQNQQAKDALEQNIGKLRDMLAENGVDVGDANIEQRQSQDQNGHAFNGHNTNSPNGGSGDGMSNEIEHSVVNMAKASSAGVDYYA